VFESEKPLCERYPSDLTDLVWRRLRHLLVRPHPKGERPCPCAAPGSAICGPTRATPAASYRLWAGPLAAHDPDRWRDQAQGPFIQPCRWVVERICAWVHRCPRRTRQDEQTPLAHEAMVVSSQIALMLRRLDRTPEPRPWL